MEQSEHKTPFRTSEKEAFKGKWLEMKYVSFNNNGKIIENYEMVKRTTRKPGNEFDGVDIIPIISFKNQPKQILLIANYRPPIDKFCLEFPAGLMDDLNLYENALRELKEETGYIGKINEKHTLNRNQIIQCDPWKSNEAGKMVFIDVDGDAPENQNPQQELEQEENIKKIHFKLDATLIDQLLAQVKENNYAIEAKLYSFALGLSLATIL